MSEKAVTLTSSFDSVNTIDSYLCSGRPHTMMLDQSSSSLTEQSLDNQEKKKEKLERSLKSNKLNAKQCDFSMGFAKCKGLKKRKVVRTQTDDSRSVDNEFLWDDIRSQCGQPNVTKYCCHPTSSPCQPICWLPPRCFSAYPDRPLSQRRGRRLESKSAPPYVSLHFMHVPPKLKKTDPIARYNAYKSEWDEREEALERKQKILRNSIKQRMLEIANSANDRYRLTSRKKEKPSRSRKDIFCPWVCKICGRRACLDNSHYYV